MSNAIDYCVVCGEDRAIRHEQQRTEFDVRGETIELHLPVMVCESCGTTEVEGDLDPPAMAFAEYRQRRGLLSPEQIKGIRKRYRLSQKAFAALLGMSEATINRYEGGSLQDQVHDEAIRACGKPDHMLDLLSRHGNRLTERQRKRAAAAAAEAPQTKRGIVIDGALWRTPPECTDRTGYREFDYQRYVAVVVWLCRNVSVVTITSLNKLLFYVDFLCFKSEAVSMTGSPYRRIQHGPVPADYGDLQQMMELQGFVEVEEVKYDNGRPGMEFLAGPKADEVDVQFSPREQRILSAVVETMKNKSPSQISDLSHREAAWLDTADRALISYDKAAELSLPVPE